MFCCFILILGGGADWGGRDALPLARSQAQDFIILRLNWQAFFLQPHVRVLMLR